MRVNQVCNQKYHQDHLSFHYGTTGSDGAGQDFRVFTIYPGQVKTSFNQ